MSSRSTRFRALVIVLLFFLPNAAHARKLLLGGGAAGRKAPSLDDSLVLSALPEGDVPPSSPIPRTDVPGVLGERPSAGRTSSIDRMLGSVPSPGVGH